MKKYLYNATAFLFMAVTAIGSLSSCSSTDEDNSVAPTEGNATTFTLNITPANSVESKDTRAATPANVTTGTENTINHVQYFILNGKGKIKSISTYLANSKTTSLNYSSTSFSEHNANVEAGDTVMVAVNCPQAAFSDIKVGDAKSKIYAKTLAIDNAVFQDKAPSNIASNNNLPMYGEGRASNNGDKNQVSVEVSVYHLVSKITLSELKVDLGTKITFTPTEIFVNNVPEIASISKVNPVSGYKFASNTKFYTGQTGSTAQAGVKAYLSTGTLSGFTGTTATDGTGLVTYSDASKMPVFYVTPNYLTDKGVNKATFLVIKGQYNNTVTGNSSTVYYPIYVNLNSTDAGVTGTAAYQDMRKVYPNINYKVSITIKAKGNSDPYQPVVDNTAIVNVQATNFNDHTQTYAYDTGVEIGDYLFNDGTTGKLPADSKITSSHHPIAVVFANKTSKIDQARGFKKGYAMAIGQTSGTYLWSISPYNHTRYITEDNIKKVLPSGTSISDYTSPYLSDASDLTLDFLSNNIKQDLDGYTECLALKQAAGTNWNGTNFPAAYAAMNSFSTDANGAKTTGTWTNSGWYLPSIGQYYLMVENLSGISIYGWGKSIGTLVVYVSGYAPVARNAINKYLSAITKTGDGIAKAVLIPTTGSALYDAISEASASIEWEINFFSDGTFYFDARQTKSYEETSKNAVRPVIAF